MGKKMVKKKVKKKKNQKPSSSSSAAAETVLSNDDLFTQILIRLPIRLLTRFVSVSKRWFSLITNHNFHSLYRSRNPNRIRPSGLFVESSTRSAGFRSPFPNKTYAFVPFDLETPIQFRPKTLNNSLNSDISILQACNGLFLCYSQYQNRYSVCDPTIGMFMALPNLDWGVGNENVHPGMTLVVADSLKPHLYKVLCFGEFKDEHHNLFFELRIYDSETRSWRTSDNSFYAHDIDIDSTARLGCGVYCNNSIYWLMDGEDLLLDHFVLDAEDFGQRMLTPIKGNDERRSRKSMIESRGQLLLIDDLHVCTSECKVYELCADYSGWSLKYSIDVSEVLHMDKYAVLQVVLGEREEEDSFLVLEVPRLIIRYNPVSMTSQELCRLPSLSHPQTLRLPHTYPVPKLNLPDAFYDVD